jgi:hypothetical protein
MALVIQFIHEQHLNMDWTFDHQMLILKQLLTFFKACCTFVKAEGGDAEQNLVWIKIDHGWSFPATSHIRNKIDSLLNENDDIASDVTSVMSDVAIVLDFSHVNFLDFTSANSIRVRTILPSSSGVEEDEVLTLGR